MTMIAFATYGNRAEFMTDSLNYSLGMENLGRSTKHLVMPHLDSAVISQGDCVFGSQTKTAILSASGALETFDLLAEDYVPHGARTLWGLCNEDSDPTASTIYLIGFSERRGRFVAYQYASEHDFEPVEVKGLFVTPTPFSMRPSPLEVERLREHLSEYSEIPQEKVDSMVAVWTKRKPLPPPASTGEWVWLAREVRESRALEAFSRIPVGGDVFHTVLGRGRIHTDRIHRYNDQGDEFLRLVAETYHPLSLAAPCFGCDSGRPYGECCCEPAAVDEPRAACDCGTGRAFVECCGVEAEIAVVGK